MPKAEKLLERMRATKAGWGYDDLDRVYIGYGFNKREGSSHAFYYHPEHPDICATVSRNRKLAKGYISDAIKNIDELNRRKGV
ncbi:hypothetical protein BMS3Bbin06_00307 [bacterium BMS3Bbin06]|nr:hypothetical protein BMS3Abin08_00890 [bacterium BMS3Abin08]GBE33792.1 hypothetical protein BMS3Bbin06_00307 [bacterium BMS3Bbin06]